MLAHRRDRAPWARDAAIRTDEAGGAQGSSHRTATVRGGAAAAGEPARRFVQHRRLSEPHEIRRPSAGAASDTGTRESKFLAFRADPSQYLHQCADAAARNAADEAAPESYLCGTD